MRVEYSGKRGPDGLEPLPMKRIEGTPHWDAMARTTLHCSCVAARAIGGPGKVTVGGREAQADIKIDKAII